MRKSQKVYNCIIIDDDPHAVQVIKEHISLVPKLFLITTYLNPFEALSELGGDACIDFLFLDINMQLSGLNVASLLRERVRFIIFVTGHPEHALAAFQADADRFLTKPVAFSKFIVTVNQLLYHRVKGRS